jgi:hypothetical protein
MKLLHYHNTDDQKLLSELDNKAPFQFLAGFTQLYQDYLAENIYIAYSEKLQAFIPIRFFSSKFFKLGQILHAPIHRFAELSSELQLEFFNELIEFLKQNNLCERLIQPHPYGILGAVPSQARYCEFGTYVINLKDQSIEEIFQKFHPKYQKAIVHTEKNGGSVKFGQEVLNDFYSCYHETMKRIGMPSEKLQFFEAYYKYLGSKNVTAGVVYDQQSPVGGIFIVHSDYAALCTHAGSMGETKLYGSMKFLHFEMIKKMKASGVHRYDLVGVRIGNNDPALEGVFRFKKGFGGDLKKGFLWKTDINPIKAKMYDLLIKIKHPNNRYKDIIDQVTN